MFQIGTQTTTSMPTYPSWVEGPMQDYYGALKGSGMLSGMDGFEGGVAGLNPTMSWGIGRANDLGHAATRDFSGGILDAGGGYAPTKISGADITALMDPYAERVGKSRMRELGRSYDDARARADGEAASGVAFAGAGSGNALRQAQLDRGQAIDADNVINGVLSDAWAQASGLAAENAAIDNAAGQFNSGQKLQAAMGANSAYGDYFDRMGASSDAMLGAGGVARAYDQELIDLPWNRFSRYGQALQGAPQGTSQNTPVNFDPFAAIGSIVGLGNMFGGGGNTFGGVKRNG